MAKYTVEITDPAEIAGIREARLAHNAALPDTPEVPRDSHTDYCATDKAYVQRVMIYAARSYAKQYGVSDDEIAALEAKLAAAKARRDA